MLSCAFFLGLLSVTGITAGEPCSSDDDAGPLISTPIPVHLIDRPWYSASAAGKAIECPGRPASAPETGLEAGPESSCAARPAPDSSPPSFTAAAGENLTAIDLFLKSDYTAPDAITIIGQLQNTGTETLDSIVVRFTLGHPQQGGTRIGDDRLIDTLAPGGTVSDSVSWEGFDGSSKIYFLVDAAESIAESDETDNTDSLAIGMVDQVPWVWQEVNGYCHYAGLSMLFNYHGAGNTLYETLELACCPHSVAYEDNELALLSGWMLCQAAGDLEFAGRIRNLSDDLVIRSTWMAYRSSLHSRIDAGRPFETSVDPYWLPQPDYDLLRTYGLHSGHAVVVVGYTDNAIIINDPGVGLDFLDEPPLPDPQNRGASVIVDEDTFRNAVEWTSGSSYLLLSYEPDGAMPTFDEMMAEAVDRSLWRLSGDAGTFDPALWAIFDVFGHSCYPALRADATPANFQLVFDDAMSLTGQNLSEALNLLASTCDLWGCGICWNAAAIFYGSQSYPQASRLNSLSVRLSQKGDEAWEEFLDLLDAVYTSGGNTAAAEPYLAQLQSMLDEITPMQDSVLVELYDLYGHLTDVEADEGLGQLPDSPALACYPNPFNSRTVLRFDLPASGPVRAAVYNTLGQQVRVLAEGYLSAGSHHIVWDGRDDHGHQVSSGLYFCRVESPGPAVSVKMVLMR